MRATKLGKVKALELVKDWNLWPRYESQALDATNLARIREAIKAGEELPPIIVDIKTNRIVDGFHRHEAYLKEFGDTTEITVEFREYEKESEVFKDAVRLNAKTGLPLSPRDKVHAILVMKKLKIPAVEQAKVLGMTDEHRLRILKNRTATTSTGENIPLPAGAMALAGKKLNKKEEHFARTSNGSLPVLHIRLLLNALRANVICTDTEITLLMELQGEIVRVLGKEAA